MLQRLGGCGFDQIKGIGWHAFRIAFAFFLRNDALVVEANCDQCGQIVVADVDLRIDSTKDCIVAGQEKRFLPQVGIKCFPLNQLAPKA